MLSVVTGALALTVNSAMLPSSAVVAARAPAVSMKGAMESSFVYESRVPLAESLDLRVHYTPIAESTKSGGGVPLWNKFIYATPEPGKSTSPPCGVCYHDGSGTGISSTAR